MRHFVLIIIFSLFLLTIPFYTSSVAELGDFIGGAVDDTVNSIFGKKSKSRNNPSSDDEFANSSDHPIQSNPNGAQEDFDSLNRNIINSFQDLLQIAKTTKAKVETPTGKPYPFLKASDRQLMSFSEKINKYAQDYSRQLRGANGLEQLTIIEGIWKKLGYSFDATVFDTFNSLSPNQFYKIKEDGTKNMFDGVNLYLDNERVLKSLLSSGLISRNSAIAYLEARLEFAKWAIEHRVPY